MMTKAEFLAKLTARKIDTSTLEEELEDFEEISSAARQVQTAMPGIGFMSTRKRLNCFMAVCRHLDQIVEDGGLDFKNVQFVLIILRLKNKTFRKAVSMFDIRASRYRDRERAEMPRTAQDYLSGLMTFG